MNELIKILEDASKIEDALKIGLAFVHMTENHNCRYDDFGQIVFDGYWELIEYYNQNMKGK